MSGWQVGAQVWLRRADGDSLHEAEQTCGPFVLAEVVDPGDGQDGPVEVRRVGSQVSQSCAPGALSARSGETQPDNALLMSLSQASLLENILRRYQEGGSPYTYTGGILTSVNPCKAVPELYSAATMTSYAGRLLGGNQPPHLYAMAEESYRLLVRSRSHQGMVVSGVSGAGKTVGLIDQPWPQPLAAHPSPHAPRPRPPPPCSPYPRPSLSLRHPF